MDLGLQGKIALVTGGSRGLGAEIVRVLAEEGSHVVYCSRTRELPDQLLSLADSGEISIVWLQVDVVGAGQIERCVQDVLSRFGVIDILVNNVGGVTKSGDLNSLTDEDWLNAFEFNVLSMVRFSRHVIPDMVRRQSGRIVNISSISGAQPGMFNPHYSTTKAATINFSKYLANVHAKDNICVNVVCPGPLETEAWRKNVVDVAIRRKLALVDAARIVDEEESLKIPLGRIGNSRDVAWLIATLASPISGWTTGSVFHISGGKYAAAF